MKAKNNTSPLQTRRQITNGAIGKRDVALIEAAFVAQIQFQDRIEKTNPLQ